MTSLFRKRMALAAVAIAAFMTLTACAGRNTQSIQSAPVSFLSGMPEDAPVYGNQWRTDPQAFSFAILGDKTGGGHENWPILDRAVEEINRLKPDFVIMVGDQIQGYTTDTERIAEQWDEWHSHIAPLTMPFMSVGGNHDLEQPEQLVWWRENKGLTYWDFTYAGCAFIMMNTDEMPDPEDKHLVFGEEQIAWAVDAIKRHENARHTFVVMHKPAWIENIDEWEPIEEALAGRQYTVLAGHWHTLVYEKRNGMDYIVHGATGGNLSTSPVKELGRFHHYSIVNVRDNDVSISVHEPGAGWAPSIAPVDFAQKVDALFRSTSLDVAIDGDDAVVTLTYRSVNALNNPVTLTYEPVIHDTHWEAADGTVERTLAPADSVTQQVVFRAPKDKRVPTPRITLVAEYQEREIRRINESEIHPFAVNDEITIPEWYGVGPFPVGVIDRTLMPDNPSDGVPGMFSYHPADEGLGDGSGFDYEGTHYDWRIVRENERGIMSFDEPFGISENLLGFTTAAIYSPDARSVPIAMLSDNFSQLFVNGELVTENYGTPYDVDYAVMNLNEGWNVVLVKLANHHGNWLFHLRLLDQSDHALQFAPRVP